MRQFFLFLAALAVSVASNGMAEAQQGPLRITITDGVIEPLPFALPGALVAALQALADRAGASLHMVLAAVLAVLLARWSGQEDIAIGTPVAGRRHAALEGLVGFFVNTLVLRVETAREEPFAALLARLRRARGGFDAA